MSERDMDEAERSAGVAGAAMLVSAALSWWPLYRVLIDYAPWAHGEAMPRVVAALGALLLAFSVGVGCGYMAIAVTWALRSRARARGKQD